MISCSQPVSSFDSLLRLKKKTVSLCETEGYLTAYSLELVVATCGLPTPGRLLVMVYKEPLKGDAQCLTQKTQGESVTGGIFWSL